jgi:hypothetical protein
MKKLSLLIALFAVLLTANAAHAQFGVKVPDAVKKVADAKLEQVPIKLGMVNGKFSEFEGKDNYDALKITPVTAPKISKDNYDNVFMDAAKTSAHTKQLRYGLEQIKSGKIVMKVDKSIFKASPEEIAKQADKAVDMDTKFGLRTLEASYAAKDKVKADVDKTKEQISNLKPKDDFKEEPAKASVAIDGTKQSSDNLNSATSDLEAISKLLAELAK